MAQATRCPHCQSAFRVVRDQLLLRQGWVRCGHCGQAFNALDHLFDLPTERVSAPPPAAAPVSSGRENAPAQGQAMTAAAGIAAAASSAVAATSSPAAFAPAEPPAIAQPAAPTASTLIWDDTPEPAAAPPAPLEPAVDAPALLTSPPESFAPLAPPSEPESGPVAPPAPPPPATAPNPIAASESGGWVAPPVEPIHVPAAVPLDSMPTLDDLPDDGAKPAPSVPEWIADPDETPLAVAVEAVLLDVEPPPEPVAAGEASGKQEAEADSATPAQRSSDTEQAATAPQPLEVNEQAELPAAPDSAAEPILDNPAVHGGSEESAETLPAEVPAPQPAETSETAAAGPPAEPAPTVVASHSQPEPTTAEADEADPLTRLDLADALHYQFAPEDAAAATALAAAGRAAEPEFLRRDRRLAFWRSTPVRLALAVLALLLALLAAAQSAWFWRDDLGQRWPQTRPWLQQLCDATTGCLVGAPRDLQALVIDASSLTPAEPPPGLRLHVLLRNQSVDQAVAWPALELTLLDLQGNIRARKVLQPAQYLPPARATPQALAAGIAAGQQVSVEVRLQAQGEAPAGYRVLAFYP